MNASSLLYIAIMTFAGISIPVMAALNAALGQNLKSPTLASAVLLVVALSACILAVFYTGLPDLSNIKRLPFYYYLGGLSVAFYILSITWVAPRFGIGNAIFFVLLGQLISAAVIDHFGLFGVIMHPISYTRILGLVLMTAGLALAVRV